MSVFIRTWEKADIKDIQQHMLVIGELSAECYNCHHVGLKPSATACPQCQAHFKYISFRRNIDGSSISRFREMHPRVKIIDFHDFKKSLSKDAARKLLDF